MVQVSLMDCLACAGQADGGFAPTSAAKRQTRGCTEANQAECAEDIRVPLSDADVWRAGDIR